MKPNIIYVTGSACPYTEKKIASETASRAAEIENLRKSGFDVTEIGDPRRGFKIGMIGEAFADRPDTTIFKFSCHGNNDKGRHYLWARESIDKRRRNCIWAAQLYSYIASLTQDPVSVFMGSCGSGVGWADVAHKLPLNSTLVTFTNDNHLYSYGLDAVGYLIENAPLTAQSLFINMMCKGMKKTKNHPQITVSNLNKAETNMWELWSTAHGETINGPDGGPALKEKVQDIIGNYMSPKQFDQAIATLALYSKASIDIRHESPDTPILIKQQVDHAELYGDVVRHELLGPICAIAYANFRDSIGAFQSDATLLAPPTPGQAALAVQRQLAQ